MRESQPIRATQLKYQASSAWSGFSDWLKRMWRLGSMPQAISAAAT
jgi:hypothetical protein